MRRMRLAAALAVITASGGAAACGGGDSSGPGTTVDLSGTYTLVALLLGGIIQAPGSTGTLVFTTTTVNADITVVSPIPTIPDTSLTLAGTYTAFERSGADSIYVMLPPPLGTIPGTFAITGTLQDTLTLNLNTPLGSLGSTWYKQ